MPVNIKVIVFLIFTENCRQSRMFKSQLGQDCDISRQDRDLRGVFTCNLAFSVFVLGIRTRLKGCIY